MARQNIIPVGQFGHFIDWDEIIELAKGENGESAYELAVKGGYEGSESEWLESLKGKDSYELAKEILNFQGTEKEWLESLKGKTAYELAVENGYKGTISEWLLQARSGINVATPNSKAHIAAENAFVKFTSQLLSETQQDIARTNIGAASADEVVSITTPTEVSNAVDESVAQEAVRYTEQTATVDEQKIARTNIGAASETDVEILKKKIALLANGDNPEIGDLNELKTDIKVDIVKATNEIYDKIGDLTKVKTKNVNYTVVDSLNDILKEINSLITIKIKEGVAGGTYDTRYEFYNGDYREASATLIGYVDIPVDKVLESTEIIEGDDLRFTDNGLYPEHKYLRMVFSDENVADQFLDLSDIATMVGSENGDIEFDISGPVIEGDIRNHAVEYDNLEEYLLKLSDLVGVSRDEFIANPDHYIEFYNERVNGTSVTVNDSLVRAVNYLYYRMKPQTENIIFTTTPFIYNDYDG